MRMLLGDQNFSQEENPTTELLQHQDQLTKDASIRTISRHPEINFFNCH